MFGGVILWLEYSNTFQLSLIALSLFNASGICIARTEGTTSDVQEPYAVDPVRGDALILRPLTGPKRRNATVFAVGILQELA
jgi:hypothetical protein